MLILAVRIDLNHRDPRQEGHHDRKKVIRIKGISSKIERTSTLEIIFRFLPVTGGELLMGLMLHFLHLYKVTSCQLSLHVKKKDCIQYFLGGFLSISSFLLFPTNFYHCSLLTFFPSKLLQWPEVEKSTEPAEISHRTRKGIWAH